jgi:hypothetical protein
MANKLVSRLQDWNSIGIAEQTGIGICASKAHDRGESGKIND